MDESSTVTGSMCPRGQKTSLDLEVVIPVWTATVQKLPERRKAIGHKKQQTPALVLLDMNTLMWTDMLQLFSRNSQDDMAKDNAPKRKPARQFAAISLRGAIRYLQSTFSQLGGSAEQQGYGG